MAVEVNFDKKETKESHLTDWRWKIFITEDNKISLKLETIDEELILEMRMAPTDVWMLANEMLRTCIKIFERFGGHKETRQ